MLYIKYSDLKKFILSFEDNKDDLELISLSNLVDKYFEKDLYIDIKTFDLYICKKIIDDCIGYEKELEKSDIRSFKNKLKKVKFRYLNPLNKEKIFNFFENNYNAIKSHQKIKDYKSSIIKQKRLLNKFEIVKNNINNQKFICFDFEAYEKNQKILTELGISIYENQKIISKHFIVKENLEYKNSKKLKDKKYNFNFGQSKVLDLKSILEILKEDLKNSDFVVGQSINNDFTYISKYLQNQDYFPNDYIQMKDYNIIDTYELTFLYKDSGMGLKKALELFKIPHRNLHNGGNDSRYNLLMLEYIIKDKKIEDLKEILENTKQKLQDEQNKFDENYEIENSFTLNENSYKLDKTKRMIDIYFDTNKAIFVKSDALIASKNKVKIKSILLGGLFKSLIRSFFNSNSFYIQKINSDDKNSMASFSNTQYEKMAIINIDGKYNLNDGVFTLCDDSLSLGQSRQSFKKAVFGSNGGFCIETLTGKGRAVIAANGLIKKIHLENEELTLDEAHLLAWEDTLILEENKSNSKVSNIKSGEFFTSKVRGTGTLYISSEKINSSNFSNLMAIFFSIVGLVYGISEIYEYIGKING